VAKSIQRYLIGIATSLILAMIISNAFDGLYINRVILSTTVSAILVPIALKFFGKVVNHKTSFEVRFLTSISSTLSVSIFLILIPLQVDRSFSVWMLNTINQEKQQKINVELLKDAAADFFDPNSGEIRRRIDEQVKIGNLKITKNEEVKLSNRGSLFVRFHKDMARIFNLNKKYAGF